MAHSNPSNQERFDTTDDPPETDNRPAETPDHYPSDPHRDPPYSNTTTVYGPRPLTAGELAAANRQPIQDGDIPYYAISREDIHIGGVSTAYDGTPRIRVLYVTPDGSRGFVRWYQASEAAEAFALEEPFYAVLSRPAGTGQQHAEAEKRARYRERAEALYDHPEEVRA